VKQNTKPVAFFLSVGFWIGFIALLFLVYLLGQFFPIKYERFIYGIGGTFVAFVVTWAFLKYEKKTFKDYGLVWEKATLGRFFKGFALGTGIFAIMLVSLVIFGKMQVDQYDQWIDYSVLVWYLAIIPLALMEEIAFRAYPFIKLNKAFGLRITQIIVAIAFALYHVLGGRDIYVSLLGPGIWALVYGLAAAWSGGIALPTGIHVAINVFQPLFGFRTDFQPVWKVTSGGAATETTGIVFQILLLIVTVLLTEYYIRKKSRSS
jgi:uncharacterized protein